VAGFLTLQKLLSMFKLLNLSSLPSSNPGSGQPWLHGSGSVVVGTFTGGGGGVTDHGALSGLSDDDHTQYYNASRLAVVLEDYLQLSGGTINGDLVIGSGGALYIYDPVVDADQELTVVDGDLFVGGVAVGDALTTNPLSQFAATTSAQLRGVISDETGNGALVFANGNIGAATGTSLVLSGAATTPAVTANNATAYLTMNADASGPSLSVGGSSVSGNPNKIFASFPNSAFSRFEILQGYSPFNRAISIDPVNYRMGIGNLGASAGVALNHTLDVRGDIGTTGNILASANGTQNIGNTTNFFGTLHIGTIRTAGSLTLNTNGTGYGLISSGANGFWDADTFTFRSSVGTTRAVVDSSGITLTGSLTASGRVVTGTGANTFASTIFDNFCGVGIRPSATTSKGLHIKGLASQTAELLLIADNAGTELVKVGATGGVAMAVNTGLVIGGRSVLGVDGNGDCSFGSTVNTFIVWKRMRMATGAAFEDYQGTGLLFRSGASINFQKMDGSPLASVSGSTGDFSNVGSITAGTWIDAKHRPYTFAGLPLASAAQDKTFVCTDSTLAMTSANYGSTPSGGGSNRVRVFSNGTAYLLA
jgi:hypothetical protein